MIVLKIDGEKMPAPNELRATFYDGDSENSARSESWVMNRQRIRADMMKIQLGWRCDASDAAILMNNLNKEKFQAEIYFLGRTVVKTMYAGDRDFKAVTLPKGNSTTEVWEISCPLIEY